MRTNLLCIAIIGMCVASPAQSGPATREPPISLKDALAKAENYVRDHKFDISHSYLRSVEDLSKSAGPPRPRCWCVTWAPKDPDFLDGELRVYVYFDGRIEHGGSS
jgi:hypothetical protein